MAFGTMELVLAALAGGGIGLLSGIFGFGGGFLLVPVLSVVLKLPIELAVGAGACQVLGPATTSLLARRVGREHLRLPLTVAGGLFAGVFAGARVFAWAVEQQQFQIGDKRVPLAELIVLVTYFVILIGVGTFAIWETSRSKSGREIPRGWIAGWRIPPYADCTEFPHPKTSIVILSWFGLAIGFTAGLLGMSGGIILLPGLIYLLGMKTQQAVLSSLVIVWMTASQATVAHAWQGNVDLMLVTALLLGGTLGARIGSEFGRKIGGRQLRSGFGWLLIATSAMVGVRLIQMGS